MRRAKLACVIVADAIERVLFGYYVGTPQAHLDRIEDFLGRQTAKPENLRGPCPDRQSGMFWLGEAAQLLTEAADGAERTIQARHAGCPRTQDTLRLMVAKGFAAAAEAIGIPAGLLPASWPDVTSARRGDQWTAR